MIQSVPKNKSARRNRGFSLIETLIGVAIIGIMASVAVPTYGTYVLRTKVTEAVQLQHRARHAMIAYHQKHGKFVASTENLAIRNKAVGLGNPKSYASEVVREMWVGSTGINGKASTSAHIAMTLKNSLGVSKAGTSWIISTILFENGSYKFVCGNTSDDARFKTNIEPQYMPSSCRN